MGIVELLLPAVTLPHTDPAARRSLLAAAHEVARAGRVATGTVVAEPTVGRNYYRVTHTDRTVLLLNAAAMLVAASEPFEMVASFVDVPGADVFARHGFRVASATELVQPLTPAHLRDLTDAEQRDVAYHRPARVGDLLFNWFD